jgi:hypothetical protein
MNFGNTSPTGAPKLSDSNKMNFKGLYHYFYSAGCNGKASSGADTVSCQYSPSTNAGSGGSGTTSGYNTANLFWYPPEPGHYLVTFTGLGCNPAVGSVAYISISVNYGSGESILASALNVGCVGGEWKMLVVSTVATFDSVGTDKYIRPQQDNTFNSGDYYNYNRLVITRVA